MSQTNPGDALVPLAILAGATILGAVALTWIRRKLRNPGATSDGSSELLSDPKLNLDAETRQRIARVAANRALGNAPDATGRVVTTRCSTCGGVQPIGQPCPWCKESSERG